MYDDSRDPAASTSSTCPGEAFSPVETSTIAPMYPAPNTDQASVFHTALPVRTVASGPYQLSHAARRSATSRGPMPVTRTSLPGAAVVAVRNRCRASRARGATLSSTARSTAGRQVEVSTVGSANSIRSISAGWIEPSSAIVTTSRRIHPHVVNRDMNRWSSTNTWSRSTASRSRYSGRSWCAIVATDACSFATCDSSAIVTLSRNRRCTRVLTVRSSQVAAAEPPSPSAATSILPRSWPSTPSASTLSHSASSASGNAASIASPNATSSSAGSLR